jgi:hypothetical protein
MQKIVFFFLVIVCFTSCNTSSELSVFNNSEIDRHDELVEICLCKIGKIDPAKLIVVDQDNQQLPVQLLYHGEKTPQSFLFPVSLKAGEKATFKIKEGIPLTIPPKITFGHVIGSVDSLAMKYNRTLVCGGLDVLFNDSLYSLSTYDRITKLDSGALRISFVIGFDSIEIDSAKLLTAEVKVTQDAGSYLSEMMVTVYGDTSTFNLSAGINIPDSTQLASIDPEMGFIGYAESLNSTDITSTTKSAPEFYFSGLVFPVKPATISQSNGRLSAKIPFKNGEVYRYYYGVTHSNDAIKSDQDWTTYLFNQKKALLTPLELKIYR